MPDMKRPGRSRGRGPLDEALGSYGPLASQMLQNLCGCHRSRWEEATSAAISALEGRRRLWDAVLDKVAAL